MSLLPVSAPHPAAVELGRWTLDSYQQLRTLRAALRETGGVSEPVTFVATELATNALRHATPPTVVRLLRDADRLIVDVADNDVAAAPAVVADRPLGRGGLGLQLTVDFAIDVGWYSTGATKHVWASFPS